MSCDLLPTEKPGPHYHGNVFDVIDACWDLMIAFPPCTHLAVSGAKHFSKKVMDGRQSNGISLFMKLLKSDIPKIAIENPVGIMSRLYRKPDQIINPYEFGHSVPKATCLWLKGLPPLFATNIVGRGEYMTFPSGKRMSRWYADRPFGGEERAKIRSTTFQGIADAMAAQWGGKAATAQGIERVMFKGDLAL